MVHHKIYNLAIQQWNLAQLHKGGSGNIVRRRGGEVLTWRQQVRPNPLARNYSIELRHRIKQRPLVLVTEPNIRLLAEGRRLPHVFEDTEGFVSLCLHYSNEWNDSKLLATTIVPWAAEWLYFFEHWLFNDEWLGGGTHPVQKTRKCA